MCTCCQTKNYSQFCGQNECNFEIYYNLKLKKVNNLLVGILYALFFLSTYSWGQFDSLCNTSSVITWFTINVFGILCDPDCDDCHY